MPKFLKFLKLYRTELVTSPPAKVIANPVHVEFYRGARPYSVFNDGATQILRAGARGKRAIFHPQRIVVPDGEFTYIELTARTEESFGKRQYCEDQIDRVVTQLSVQLARL